MAQLIYQIKERPAQCTDNTPRETGTLRGAAGRSHYRPHYIRNRTTSVMHMGIFSCIDVIVHKAVLLKYGRYLLKHPVCACVMFIWYFKKQ